MTGAIYHFTDGSEKRPGVYEKQIKELEKFANSLKIDVLDIYLDKSLLVEERDEFERFRASCEKYDALVTKDFYHISKNTRACMDILKTLSKKGVTTYSIENGAFEFSEPPLNRELRVATYTYAKRDVRDVDNLVEVQQDIYELFVEKKTNWTLVQQYADICSIQNDESQVEMLNMLDNKDKFDLLLVTNLNDIHCRTSKCCKLRELLGKDIHSLQDGFLEYRRI